MFLGPRASDFRPHYGISTIFWSIFGIIGGGKAVNKSAASAASPDSVKFQAVIKSAASAASPKAKSRKARPRGLERPGDGPAGG